MKAFFKPSIPNMQQPIRCNRFFSGSCILGAVFVCLFCAVALFSRLSPPVGQYNDFLQDWAAARNFWDRLRIYGDLNDTIPMQTGIQYRGSIERNVHPPFSVLITLPLAKRSYYEATAIWNAVSLMVAVVSIYILASKAALCLQFSTVVWISFFLMTSNALHQQVFQAQWNLVLLACLVIVWTAEKNGLYSLAGGVLAIATMLKLFPAFLLVYFCLRGRWAALAWFLVIATMCIALTIFTFGLNTYHDYLFIALRHPVDFRDWWLNASVAGFWSKLFDAPSGHSIPIVHAPVVAKAATLASVVTVSWSVGRTCKLAKTQLENGRAFCLCVIAMLLVSPVTWNHYFVLLLLPLAFLWKNASKSCLYKVIIVSLTLGLCTIAPKNIWDITISGDGELAYGPHLERSVASPLQCVTVLSYQTYLLVLLFLFCRYCVIQGTEEQEMVSDPRLN